MRPQPHSGFSLLEVLFAGVIYLAVVLAIVPLFSRATLDRLAGRAYSESGAFAADRQEQLRGLPLGSVLLRSAEGASLLEVVEVRNGEGLWEEGASPGSHRWIRTTRVELHSLARLVPRASGSGFELGEPLAEDADDGLVHFRRLEVTMQGRGPGSIQLGSSSRMSLRSLRAF